MAAGGGGEREGARLGCACRAAQRRVLPSPLLRARPAPSPRVDGCSPATKKPKTPHPLDHGHDLGQFVGRRPRRSRPDVALVRF